MLERVQLANSQDAAVALKSDAAGLLVWAQQVAVATKEDADSAMTRLSEIKAVRKRWTDYWAPLKKAANGAWKGIVAKEKEGTDLADRAEAVVKGKVLAWQQAEHEKAEEVRRKLQAEADAKARAEQERLLAIAAKRKTETKKEEYRQAAAAVVAPTVVVAAEKVTAAGTVPRTTYRAVLEDMTALIAAAAAGHQQARLVLSFDNRAADGLARALKVNLSIPGVRVEEVESLSVRMAGKCGQS